MIFLTTRKASGAVAGWVETSRRSADMENRITVQDWEGLAPRGALNAEPTVLTDFERFYPSQQELANAVWQALDHAAVPRLNDPSRVLCRPRLLDCLYSEGLNVFRAVGAGDTLDGLRYPVFVREANEHTGSLTTLLANRRKLDRSLTVLTRLGGFRRDELLVVEFCDTRDTRGAYRKYSAVRFGDTTLARAMTVSNHWMVKDNNRVVDEEIAAAELEFVSTHPHRDWVERVFALAGIEYGRVDYAVLDGCPQAWEINTNPQVGPRARKDGGPRPRNAGYWLRQEAKGLFHDAFRDLLRAFDDRCPGGREPIPLPLDPGLIRRLRDEGRWRRLRDHHHGAVHRLRESSALRRVIRVAART